jgi:hypothetical protein
VQLKVILDMGADGLQSNQQGEVCYPVSQLT